MSKDKIRLAPISDVEPDRLRDWRNNPYIFRWCRQVFPLEKFEHENWLKSLHTRDDVKMFSIWLNQTPIGVCGLTSIDLINRRAEFSLYLSTSVHGKGYGKQALKLLLGVAFYNLNLHLVWGETFEGNPASRTFECLGFKKEGTRRDFYFKDGKYIDAHLYSVKRCEVLWTG